MATKDLRALARSLFDIGVRAADPAAAVKKALQSNPLPSASRGRHFVIALGKAACPMVEGALAHLPKGAANTAIAVTN